MFIARRMRVEPNAEVMTILNARLFIFRIGGQTRNYVMRQNQLNQIIIYTAHVWHGLCVTTICFCFHIRCLMLIISAHFRKFTFCYSHIHGTPIATPLTPFHSLSLIFLFHKQNRVHADTTNFIDKNLRSMEMNAVGTCQFNQILYKYWIVLTVQIIYICNWIEMNFDSIAPSIKFKWTIIIIQYLMNSIEMVFYF